MKCRHENKILLCGKKKKYHGFILREKQILGHSRNNDIDKENGILAHYLGIKSSYFWDKWVCKTVYTMWLINLCVVDYTTAAPK